MERIELFDNYINNQLSDVQRSEFDARLESDEEFASDFNVYSAIVIGICKEAEQNNKDFEMAMKNISKDKLKEIIGWQPRIKDEPVDKTDSKHNITDSPVIAVPIYRRQWLWQAASIALIVTISAICIFNINHNADIRIAEANQQIDNALYVYAYVYDGPSRGGFSVPDLNTLNDAQLKEILPKMVEAYEESNHIIGGGEVDEDLYEYGYPLAMAYLRLHERDKALDVLNNLIAKFSRDEDYAYEISKLKSIVNALK